MDKDQQMRLGKIYNCLEKDFNEEKKKVEPVIERLKNLTQKATDHVFRVYRNKCKSNFDELERYTTIGENAELKLKNEKDSEKAFSSFVKVLDCIIGHDKDFGAATKSLNEQTLKLSTDYDNCIMSCGNDSAKKSDVEIRECFMKCNDQYMNIYTGVSENIADDFSKLISKLEKL